MKPDYRIRWFFATCSFVLATLVPWVAVPAFCIIGVAFIFTALSQN
jgi:hypothetical protein